MQNSIAARTLNSAGSFGVNTLGSPQGAGKTGIKSEVDALYGRIQEHEDAITRLDATIEKNASAADESVRAVQASLRASIASLRDEMHRKFAAITVELAQLQKAVNVQRGEQSILAQQQKDTAKRVENVAVTVSELMVDVRGGEALSPSANY